MSIGTWKIRLLNSVVRFNQDAREQPIDIFFMNSFSKFVKVSPNENA